MVGRYSLPSKVILLFSLTTILWGIIFFILLLRTHLEPVGNSFVATPSTYGDLPFHLSIITSFAYGENFPPVNPLAPFNRLSYHFLADYISSTVLLASGNFRVALIAPSLIFGMLTIIAFYVLVYRISKSILASLIAPVLFFLNGGLGFVKFFENILDNGLVNTLAVKERYAHISSLGIDYPNILAEILMAERALFIGIPLALTCLLFLYMWLEKRNTYLLFWAGIPFGLLPYANIYGYLVIGIFSFLLFLMDLWRRKSLSVINDWYIFGIIGILIPLPFFIFIAPQVMQNDSFVRFSFGEWPPLASNAQKLLFWLTNFGIVPVLAVVAILKKGFLNSLNRKFLGLLSLIIVFAHFIIFQPHAWDNNRFILYPYIAISILASLTVARFISANPARRFLGLTILMLSIAQGLLVTIYDPQIRYPLYGKTDFQFAEFIRKNTPADSIFLTARNHNHPVVSLAGRRIVLGYGGYLWTQGIEDPPERANAINSIYEGKGEIDDLIKSYKVKYIVVGPWEREEFPLINETAIVQRYDLIYDQNDIKVFDINLPNENYAK